MVLHKRAIREILLVSFQLEIVHSNKKIIKVIQKFLTKIDAFNFLYVEFLGFLTTNFMT